MLNFFFYYPIKRWCNKIYCFLNRALIKACTQGNVTAVRKLLKQGISVNETSEEGESLLSLACSAGYYELAQVSVNAPTPSRWIENNGAAKNDTRSRGDRLPDLLLSLWNEYFPLSPLSFIFPSLLL